jgi:beta-mannosidase
MTPELRKRRPRGRWPTHLFPEKNLRFVRTSLLGYLPGHGPAVPTVGPFRPIRRLSERAIGVDELSVRPRLEGADGLLELRLGGRSFLGGVRRASLTVGGAHAALECESSPGGVFGIRGIVRVPSVLPWWPHTHGRPALHPARVELACEMGEAYVELEPVGFRTVEALSADEGGFALRINGEPVFARGACFMPLDALALASEEGELRRVLGVARDAGMNMLRIPGTTAYESDAFYRLCDELGILVFQDFMFANMDYPADDPAFVASVREEVDQLLARVGSRPSLAVLSGGSEVLQQAAMMGLERGAYASELFDRLLPERCERLAPGVPYVPGSPCGGAMPFHVSEGIAHYYGVGAYLRPIDDARLHRVRFAAECLAFSNVPEDETLVEWLGHARLPAHDPRYKERVPRDPSAGWDFADVTDHYLEALFGVDARTVRYADHDRYLALCRATTAEVMERVQRLLRIERSTCHGALVYLLRDLWEGAGFGLLDAHSRPKAPYYALSRAWAELAAFFVDEGLDGLVLHVLNDRPEPFRGEVELTLSRADGQVVEAVRVGLEVPPRRERALGVDAALGRFVDSSYAYRFGPPAHAIASARLFAEGGVKGEALAHAHHLPLGLAHERTHDVGLTAEASEMPGGAFRL